jgi:hypothetical protein
VFWADERLKELEMQGDDKGYVISYDKVLGLPVINFDSAGMI